MVVTVERNTYPMLKEKVDFSRIGGYNSGNHKDSSLLYVSSERKQLRYVAANILKPNIIQIL